MPGEPASGEERVGLQIQPPVETQTVAAAIAAAFKRHGVDIVFGQSLPSQFFLATPLYGIRQLAYRTENAGVAMADGYARASHRVGVVAAQNGPAAALLVPGLAEAMAASVPIVALVQEVPLGKRGRNAFQEMDHVALFSGVSKWTGRIDSPYRATEQVDRAFQAAASGRGGPAVLLVAKDVLDMALRPAEGRSACLGEYPIDRVRPDSRSVEQAARLLAQARRPLVVAGGGVHLSNAADALHRLQSQAFLPVATTTMGKGTVDESDPLSLGVVTNYMGERGMARHVREYISQADVLLLVGSRTNENGTDSWQLYPSSATFIHVDVDPLEIGRNYEAIRLVGDARAALEDLLVALGALDLEQRRTAAQDVMALTEESRRRHKADSNDVLMSDAAPIRPERVMRELDCLLTEDTVVVADASYSTIWMGNYLHAKAVGQRFLSPRGLAGLGWGLPIALGAKAALPDSRVICIVGDGGFAHVWAELETAVRENLAITIVVLNNSKLAYQKHSELVQFGEHSNAVDLGPVDHAMIATACGVESFRVEHASDLEHILKQAMISPKVALVEVICDPYAYPPITAWDGHRDRIVADEPTM